ncbi:MAG: hypothetical protein CBB97_26475 [Candidatus Endolissoclinum sp. TMED37]|nr:MAG: hypothetical protein CBB97_26475 [Candidatus Endolissoclinum sp. TMED37]|tara:strand:- start:102 stop:356 length:255 start_codon:yes stop_codon:yes gene_type:complete
MGSMGELHGRLHGGLWHFERLLRSQPTCSLLARTGGMRRKSAHEDFFTSRYWKLANVVVEARIRLVCRRRNRKKQEFANAVKFL